MAPGKERQQPGNRKDKRRPYREEEWSEGGNEIRFDGKRSRNQKSDEEYRIRSLEDLDQEDLEEEEFDEDYQP